MDGILGYSELRPFTIQGFCLRAVNQVLADGRTKIVATDIEAIKELVLAEVASIRGVPPHRCLLLSTKRWRS